MQKDGNAKGFKGSTDVGLLLRQVSRCLGTCRLVTCVINFVELLGLDIEFTDRLHGGGGFIPVNRSTALINGCEVVWSEVFPQFVDHVDEDVGRSGGNTGTRGHRP